MKLCPLHNIVFNKQHKTTMYDSLYLNMGLEPRYKSNSSYLRGQGVKNKLPTLELKLLSSVNGLFLTGACIVKERNIL